MRSLLLAIVFSAVAASLVAQEKPKMEKVTINGTVKAIGPSGLQVEIANGDTLLVALAQKAEVFVSGQASPDMLKPGMSVRFSGKFNKKAQSTEPISAITIFSPRPQPPKPREEAGGGLAKGFFQTDEPKPEPKREPKNVKPPDTFDVSSSGAITNFRNGKLSVRGAEAAFTLELTSDVKITLDVNDLRLAKEGDKVTVEGWKYPADPGKVSANRVSIQLTDLVGEKKKPTSKEK